MVHCFISVCDSLMAHYVPPIQIVMTLEKIMYQRYLEYFSEIFIYGEKAEG